MQGITDGQSQRGCFPSVSILINNYNYERFLSKCIQSCLSQTQKPLEIIVVDDGSVDASAQIIREYSETSDLVLPVFKANGGQASALNVGFRQSRGELIMLLDADDYLYPWAVERVAETWQRQAAEPRSAVMVQSRLDMVDCQEGYIDQYPPPELLFDDGDVVPLLLKAGRYSTTVTSGLSFSRQAMLNLCPIPEQEFRLCADGYLVTLAPFYGPVVSLETSIGGRRKHEHNLWSSGCQSAAQFVEQRRRGLEHDFARYRYLLKTAHQLDHPAKDKLGCRDPLHLTDRIASLRLEPQKHPVTGDRSWMLAMRGVKAVWEYSNLSHRRRVVLMIWFLAVGILPQSWATHAIHWRLLNQSRPQALDRALKMLRTASQ